MTSLNNNTFLRNNGSNEPFSNMNSMNAMDYTIFAKLSTYKTIRNTISHYFIYTLLSKI